jgi:hypothetical protein
MHRLSYVLLAAALAVAGAVEIATFSLLPAVVPARFAADGTPRGFTVRDVYIATMLGITIGLPLLVVLSMAWLPRVAPRSLNLPHRDYWLAPPRRAGTLATLGAFVCVLGSMVALFAMSVHLLIVDTNLAPGGRLSPAFIVLLAGFVAGVASWIAALYWRFRRPDA